MTPPRFFYNTFNAWFTAVPPLLPIFFKFYNTFNAWFTSALPHPPGPPPHHFFLIFTKHLMFGPQLQTPPPAPFFYNTFNAWFTSARQRPLPRPIFTLKFYNTFNGSHPLDLPTPHFYQSRKLTGELIV